MSPSYYKRLKQRRLERSRKGVEARARKHAERTAGERVRMNRVVEIVIRDTHRPMTVIQLRREDQGERWGRWRGIGKRAMGRTGVARLLAQYLE